MATYSTLGITLLVRKYKGTGRVVSFYTPTRGKVEAVAQGIGRPASKLAAAVELFTLSKLMFAEGRDLDRLIQVEVIEAHYALRQDMTRLAYASYIAELTAKTSEPDHPLPGLFERLAATYSALCGATSAGSLRQAQDKTGQATDPELVLWSYLMRLFQAHGLAPDLEVCYRCRAALSGDAWYVPADAGLVCGGCRPGENGMLLSAEARGTVQSIQRMPPEKLGRLSLGDEARGQIRRFIDAHTDHQFGVETKSRKFIRQLRGMSRGR